MLIDMKQFYLLYKTTNIETGEHYIGVHMTKNLNDGYLGSGKRIQHAVEKYGFEKFHREVLEYCENVDDMYNKEAQVILVSVAQLYRAPLS